MNTIFTYILYYDCRKNGQDIGGSYYHRVNSNIEAGLGLEWSSATKATQGGVAAKYVVNPETSMKVKAAFNGLLGLSVQQKISESRLL